MNYELWDTETGNIVADAKTLTDVAKIAYESGQANPSIEFALSVIASNEITREPDLNSIKIPISGLRNLAIEMMQEGLTEIGLKDLLHRMQTMYRKSKD